jgi:hypothetical protein
VRAESKSDFSNTLFFLSPSHNILIIRIETDARDESESGIALSALFSLFPGSG